jgi:hypothetical protein
MKTRDDHIEFLKLNHLSVAATAWNGFQEKGRGVIVVLCDQHDEMMRTVPFDFMPEGDLAKMIKPWKGSKEGKMISDYDPEKEVVIMFARSQWERHDTSCYRFPTPTPPPVAAEM